MAIRPYRTQDSGVRSHNFKGFQFKLTVIKIITTYLGLGASQCMNKAKNLSLLGNSGQTPRRRQTQGNADQERQQLRKATGNI
ncbi:MAG: hypothetical protein F6K01_28520 [Okeania sp. SIO1I7]|nr:hypothetical protein [Okeania sp. SIO1I7]